MVVISRRTICKGTLRKRDIMPNMPAGGRHSARENLPNTTTMSIIVLIDSVASLVKRSELHVM
jgi:hypothetical protein